MAKLEQCTSCKKYHATGGECGYYILNDKECTEYELPYNNSEGMFKHLFSFKGRIRRLEYCMTYLFYWLYSWAFEAELDTELGVLWAILFIPILWITIAQGAKRCHDRGNNLLFQFIPFYIFWMLFADGEEGVNRFGTSPKKSYEEQIYKKEKENCNIN